jgi:hypothetical protein
MGAGRSAGAHDDGADSDSKRYDHRADTRSLDRSATIGGIPLRLRRGHRLSVRTLPGRTLRRLSQRQRMQTGVGLREQPPWLRMHAGYGFGSPAPTGAGSDRNDDRPTRADSNARSRSAARAEFGGA